MGAREFAMRLRDESLKMSWRRFKGRVPAESADAEIAFAEIPIEPTELDAGEAAGALLSAAERIVCGHLPIFGREIALPQRPEDWFLDTDTGLRAPAESYTFDIDTRSTSVVGNHKFLFEPSRLQHITLLAAAWFMARRAAFAELAARQLTAWWQANPFLCGVHWTSGIEVGLRLLSFVWVRRLLKDWPGARACFEESPFARAQILGHQRYLATFASHGSSANNHRIAELVGLAVGAAAFPWHADCEGWAEAARRELLVEAERQTFADGMNREQASDYHGFVLEMLMVAAVEDVAAARPPALSLLEVIRRMADAWAATLDCRQHPPRWGDSDDAYALLLDPPDRDRRPASLLAAAAALVEPAVWWPPLSQDIRSCLFAALCRRQPLDKPTLPGRTGTRCNMFEETGLVLLRDLEPRKDELWCLCDHGPHGFLAIAAHAHADALSIEVRHGGVVLLGDPGTYCYLTEPEARRYFRSTLAHNTLEIGCQDQARSGGPFLWLDAPVAALISVEGLDGGPVARWTARHHGYGRLSGQPVHERSVRLDRENRRIEIEDCIQGRGRFTARLAFHLGPAIEANLDRAGAELAWAGASGAHRARLSLPPGLTWRVWRGSMNPMLGWYSPCFGQKQPATSLIGEGAVQASQVLRTVLALPVE